MKADVLRSRLPVLKVLAAPMLLVLSLAPMVLTATSVSAVTGINQLSINDVSKDEGNAGTTNFTFTVTLSPPAPDTVTVMYATADGTAKDPSDYASQSGTLTFNPSETSKTITIAVVGDTSIEPNETFFVNLSSPTNATIARAQGTGTIVNDDSPTPNLFINDVSHTEGNSGNTNADFTVTLSQSSTSTVTVHWATADGTAKAPGDYVANSGDLTYTPGQTIKTVSVAVVGDTSAEPDETFFVNLTAPVNATIADAQGVGTIVNDDGPPPGLSINDVSVAEGNTGTTNATFTVTLSPTSTQTVTVHWATADGTAKAGQDYTANSGDLTFAPSENSKTLTVLVTGDTNAEPNETFTVNLSSPNNAYLVRGQGVGTIVNDDGPVPTLSINDVSMPEGNSGTSNANFTVTLSPPSTLTVTVDYATADGTATAPSDYLSTSGTLTFNASETTKTIPVAVVGDTTPEANETFTVNLTNANNAAIGKAQGVGTIVNDDAKTGGYTVKSTGGVFAYNGAAAATGSPSWSTDVVRGIGEDPGAGYVLDDWGGLHPFSGAPAATGGPFWPGQDVARDVALIPNSNAGYVLDDWGGLHPFNGAAAATGGPYFQGRDVARRIVILANGTGGYVLDNAGGLHPFAIGANPLPGAVTGAAYWPNQDVARGVVLSGGGGYTLDDWGGLHTFKIGSGSPPPTPTGVAYWPGQDVARGVALAPGGGGYTLDDWGALHSFTAGATPPSPTGSFYTPGIDSARGIT